MARVNQGKYKEYKNKYKELCVEYTDLIERYFDETGFSDDYVVAFDFLGSANNLYERAENLKLKIETMLETQKFEQEKKKKYYEECVIKLGDILYELASKAGEVRRDIGNDVSENEKYSLDNWKI